MWFENLRKRVTIHTEISVYDYHTSSPSLLKRDHYQPLYGDIFYLLSLDMQLIIFSLWVNILST
jgi:hypothetical protein